MVARTAVITDPTDITTSWSNASQASGIFTSTEVYIDADNKTFYFQGAGNLNAAGSGVTGQALYSFFKDRWRNDEFLPRYEFPMLSITNEQFEFINGWKPDDTQAVLQDDQGTDDFSTTTRKMIRTAGWSETETNGNVSRRYFGVVSLGTLADTDAPYYVSNTSYTATTATTEYTGTVNEAVQFYGVNDTDAGSDAAADDFAGLALGTGGTVVDFVAAGSVINFTAAHNLEIGDVIKITGATEADNNGFFIVDTIVDTDSITVKESLVTETVGASFTHVGFDRSEYFKLFCRTRGKTYASADLAGIGVSETTYIVYRFPLTNATDLNINTTDDNAFTGATISAIDGDATTITVDTTAAHGLYAGAPVTITGTTNYNADFVVASVTDANTFTISSTNHNFAVENTGTSKLRYVDDIDVKYINNPDAGSGNIIIRGDYATGVAYALGDVVHDSAGTDEWYYVDANPGTSAGPGTIAGETSGITWTKLVESNEGTTEDTGVLNIEEDDAIFSAYTVFYDLNAGDVANTQPGATKEVAYEWAQWKLRSTSTIDVDTSRNGDVADPLVFFVGTTLETYKGTGLDTDGSEIPFAVGVTNIADTDVNNIIYHEAVVVDSRANDQHRAPSVVPVVINFNSNLFGDAAAIFKAYYTTGEGAQTGNDFGSNGALLLRKTSGGVTSIVGADVSYDVPANGTYSFNYAYTADATNGRQTGSNATDVAITVVAIGLGTGQYVISNNTITSTGATVSLVAPLERNYSNP